jgi:hypothetical protein
MTGVSVVEHPTRRSQAVNSRRYDRIARSYRTFEPLYARVVVIDLGLTEGVWSRLLDPIARLLLKFTPGDPYSDPWSDLAAYGPVATKRFLLGPLLCERRLQVRRRLRQKLGRDGEVADPGGAGGPA